MSPVSRLRWSVIVSLLAVAPGGCGGCGDEPKTEQRAGASEARPGGQTETPTPTVEQLPLPQDFAIHAGQRVTDETYRAELDELEREIGPAKAAETAESAP